jgi:hypothetical protein
VRLGCDFDRKLPHVAPCPAKDSGILAGNFFQIWPPFDAIGVSYFFLIVTLRRTLGQRLVGIFIGVAFVLWGSEQFLGNQALISFIDDVVVFLFVVDLSIVIRQNLKNCADERLVGKAVFPPRPRYRFLTTRISRGCMCFPCHPRLERRSGLSRSHSRLRVQQF